MHKGLSKSKIDFIFEVALKAFPKFAADPKEFFARAQKLRGFSRAPGLSCRACWAGIGGGKLCLGRGRPQARAGRGRKEENCFASSRKCDVVSAAAAAKM